MIRFFKSPQPASLIFIPIIILLLWIQAIFHSTPVADSKSLPFWNLISGVLSVFPSWLNFILLFILISGEAIYLNLMLNRHEILYKNSFLPALIFALLISSSTHFLQFHPIHLVNLIIIRILDRLFTLFKSELPISALFDCGFFVGIATCIYFPAFILLPFLLIAITILRPFRIKEWLIILIAFFLPCFFLSVYLFWNETLFRYWHSYFEMFRNIHPQILIEKNLREIILIVFVAGLLLLSLIKLRMNYRKNIIRARSFQQIFFVFFLSGAAWLFFCEKIQIIHFAFIVIPVTVYIAYYFLSAKKKVWLYEYALWTLIAIIVWNHLG